MILPNIYSLYLSFSTMSTEHILLFFILKYRIHKMILDIYLNSKYSNCKTPFSFLFLFLKKYQFRNNTNQARSFSCNGCIGRLICLMYLAELVNPRSLLSTETNFKDIFYGLICCSNLTIGFWMCR